VLGICLGFGAWDLGFIHDLVLVICGLPVELLISGVL
jgi:hypothetical protein